jgi:hypothetical protein
MPVFFRLISVTMALVLMRAAMVVFTYSRADWIWMLRAGSYGWATLAMLLLWFSLGPFAVVQLWRSREWGRRAGSFLSLSMSGYFIFFWVNATVYLWFMILAGLAYAFLLLSPPAKRACQRQWTERQILALIAP